MAQSKLNDFAGRFSKGPKGLGTGLKLLALAGAAGYGITQSMYTGKCYISNRIPCEKFTEILSVL